MFFTLVRFVYMCTRIMLGQALLSGKVYESQVLYILCPSLQPGPCRYNDIPGRIFENIYLHAGRGYNYMQ